MLTAAASISRAGTQLTFAGAVDYELDGGMPTAPRTNRGRCYPWISRPHRLAYASAGRIADSSTDCGAHFLPSAWIARWTKVSVRRLEPESVALGSGSACLPWPNLTTLTGHDFALGELQLRVKRTNRLHITRDAAVRP